MLNHSNNDIKLLIKHGVKLPLATKNYPSRGQTSVQELYQTDVGKLFLKRVSERNHIECQVNAKTGSLAEREFWAFSLAEKIGLNVPKLWLIDKSSTVQIWLDYPDGHIYKKSTGPMDLEMVNIFDCVLFDWITGQVDRHDANYLYNFKDNQIIPVDSAHCFLKYEGSLPDYLHIYEIRYPQKLNEKISSDIKKNLQALSKKELKKIVPLIDENEWSALLTRKGEIEKVETIGDLLDLYRSKK